MNMIRIRMLSLVLAAAALGATAFAADPVKPFQSIIPNNIFSATNPPRVRNPGGPGGGGFGQRPQIEHFPAPILTGVVVDDKDYVAFVEERSGKVTLARVGYKIPQPQGLPASEWPLKNQGTITAITLYYVEVTPADGSAVRKVELGRNLADDSLITTMVNAVAPATAPDPATAPAADKTVEAPAAAFTSDDATTAAMKAKRAALMGTTQP